MPNVNDLTLSTEAGAIQIAEATSYDRTVPWENQRWTDLEVWHRPGMSPRFVAEAAGVSTFPGESVRRRRLAGSTVEKVLRLFAGVDGGEPTSLGKLVIAQAQAWAAEQRDRFTGDTISAALAWLYDGMEGGEAWASRAARDFGMSPRPFQKAQTAESDSDEPAKVTVPLLAILPYLNRAAFQEASEDRAAAAQAAA